MISTPFLASRALTRGALTRHDLRTRYRPVFRDVYIGADAQLTAEMKAHAAWLSTGSPLAGQSAAAVLGTRWLDPDAPAEIIRADRHHQPGMVVRSYRLADDEVVSIHGVHLTTAARTAFDLGRQRPARYSIALLDALFNATRIGAPDVMTLVDRYPGARGIRHLRMALRLADGGAESPRETTVRLLLVNAGFPPPETQIELRGLHPRCIRLDMGWRETKVAVEYDGIQHWSDAHQRAWDIDRLAVLESAGWKVVRVSAAMLGRPEVIVGRVRSALADRGVLVPTKRRSRT